MMEQEARQDEEILAWFDRLTAAEDSDELERLWEERGTSGQLLLEAFILRQLDGALVLTTSVSSMLQKTRPGEVRDQVVRRVLTLLDRVSERHCDLAHRLRVADAEAVSRWPYVFRDVPKPPASEPKFDSARLRKSVEQSLDAIVSGYREAMAREGLSSAEVDRRMGWPPGETQRALARPRDLGYGDALRLAEMLGFRLDQCFQKSSLETDGSER